MVFRLAADAFYFMQTSSPLESMTQNGIPALKAASSLLLYSARSDSDFLLRLMSENGSEVCVAILEVRENKLTHVQASNSSKLYGPCLERFSY